MTTRQRAFIEEYSDPNSPYFLNQTKAYQHVYKCNYDTARADATKLLAKSHIKIETDIMLNALGASKQDRMKSILSIALNKATPKRTVTKHYDKEGNLVGSTEVEKTPTYTEQLKACELLCKLTGDFEKVKVAGDVARSEVKRLSKQLLKDLDTKSIKKAEKTA